LSLLLLWLFVAAIGHAAVLAYYVNRLHAQALPRKIVKSFSWPMIFAIPLGWLAWINPLLAVLRDGADGATLEQTYPWFWAYTIVAAPLGMLAILIWLWRKGIGDPWRITSAVTTERVNVEQALNKKLCRGWKAKLLSWLPGNEFCRVSFEEQTLAVPRLPKALVGLRIAHLSDFHFTGQLAEDFYDYVVERVNAWQPELVVLTGDFLDHDDCLPWLTRVFAKLSDPSRAFYVLGNHDAKQGRQREINRALEASGIIDVGGGPWRIVSARNTPILIAGNEEPWLGPSLDLELAPKTDNGRRLFRILLAHTPDQIGKAVEADFDLMFAGHTHGGQISLPLIGPIFTPSAYGTRLQRGTFRRNNTVLHVSRGLSSDLPFRWGSCPQVSLLTLQQP
jgi:predicted MPP superfamily phosphohydrolase